MIHQIKTIIQDAIPDAFVEVSDPKNDGHHFEALVVSNSFEGKSLIEQHQKVMKALKKNFDTQTVHSLRLKTLTPKEYKSS